MLPQEPQLIRITPRNHSIDTTLFSTDLRHILVELNSVSPHEMLIFDMIELGNNKESDISLFYEQPQVKNDQAKQETHKNIVHTPRWRHPRLFQIPFPKDTTHLTAHTYSVTA